MDFFQELTFFFRKDFCGVLSSGQVVPNLLHVGHVEAERLCGNNPGNLIDFIRWARIQSPKHLALVHVRSKFKKVFIVRLFFL
jgi:hypothetical protein